MANRNTIECPTCHGKVKTITSRKLSDTVREIYFDCVDVDCATRFVAHLGVVRVLVPSLKVCLESNGLVHRRPNDIIVRTNTPAPAGSQPLPKPSDDAGQPVTAFN